MAALDAPPLVSRERGAVDLAGVHRVRIALMRDGVQTQWLARSGCRIRLHFIPSYCPHLDPIERLWGLMHRHCTHNKCYAGFKDFSRAVLTFLRERVPRNWHDYRDVVTDNFRIIDPADFRVLA